MGYPFNEALIDLLKEMYNPIEAEVALAIPNNLQLLRPLLLECRNFKASQNSA
jgi:hypothetical protein